MSQFRLLLVEDEEQEIQICKNSIARYLDQKGRKIDMNVCRTVEEALKTLDNRFDGAIIDLKLADQGDEGSQVVKEIEESFFRIPVAILTGTPDNASDDFKYIGVYTKGEIEYIDLFDRFWGIYDTGMTRIVGGRGLIEKALSKVFRDNLLPKTKQWEEYGKQDSAKTEKALLRHTLNHLSQLLEEEDQCFPEEMYLAPPLSARIQTGSIVKERKSDKWFVILNPACDLVLRKNAKPKTDWILAVEIDPVTAMISWLKERNPSENIKPRLKKAFRNNETTFHHCLPKTSFFEGGFLNFRKLCTVRTDEFPNRFQTPPTIQIAPSFIKDVISRFSTYYARQGQPDLEMNAIERNWVADTK